MNRSFLGRAALTLVLIGGVAGSALPYDAGSDFGTAYEQIIARFEITALIFKPAQTDAIRAVVRDMHLTPQNNSTDENGQYVLDAASRAEILSVLQKYGEVERHLHQRGPVGDNGRAGAFSVRAGREFSASMQVRYIPSVRHLPPAFAMNYSLSVGLQRQCTVAQCDSARQRYASGGSVLVPDKGVLMSVRKTSNGFLIWLISAN